MSLDSAATALVQTTARGFHYLIELDFADGPLYYTTHAVDIRANGHTYTGYGNLVDVSPLGESENAGDDKLSLGLSIVNTALIAACVGNVQNYRGRTVRIYIQFIGPTFVPVGAPVLVWRGYMEPVQIERTQSSDNSPSTGRISLPCRRAGLARSRNADGLRLSDAQHQSIYPGDAGYEFVQTLMERPTPIVTKAFQESFE